MHKIGNYSNNLLLEEGGVQNNNKMDKINSFSNLLTFNIKFRGILFSIVQNVLKLMGYLFRIVQNVQKRMGYVFRIVQNVLKLMGILFSIVQNVLKFMFNMHGAI